MHWLCNHTIHPPNYLCIEIWIDLVLNKIIIASYFLFDSHDLTNFCFNNDLVYHLAIEIFWKSGSQACSLSAHSAEKTEKTCNLGKSNCFVCASTKRLKLTFLKKFSNTATPKLSVKYRKFKKKCWFKSSRQSCNHVHLQLYTFVISLFFNFQRAVHYCCFQWDGGSFSYSTPKTGRKSAR